MVLIFILYALFASSFVISKEMLTYTSPILLVAIRMLLGGSLLLAYQYLYKKESFSITRSDIKYFLIISICGIYMSYTMRYWSLSFMATNKAYFLYKSAPFVTAILSYYMLHEKLSRIQWLSIGLGFLGLIPILMSTSAPLEDYFGSIFRISLPECLILCSVASLCMSKIILRKFIRTHAIAIPTINGITMIMGGSMALITSLCVEPRMQTLPEWPFFALLAASIIISNMICYNLYAHLLKTYTATFISLTGFSSIFFAAFYGWVLFGETITWHYALSAAIIGISLFLFYREESRRVKCA